LFRKKNLTSENENGIMRDMKVGDLLTEKSVSKKTNKPLLIVTEIREHHENSNMDRIQLRWLSRIGGEGITGELSRLIVEKRYKVI
jgi:hypothetical protein